LIKGIIVELIKLSGKKLWVINKLNKIQRCVASLILLCNWRYINIRIHSFIHSFNLLPAPSQAVPSSDYNNNVLLLLFQRLWSHPTCWRYINKSIIIIIITFVLRAEKPHSVTICGNLQPRNAFSVSHRCRTLDEQPLQPLCNLTAALTLHIYDFSSRLWKSLRMRACPKIRSGPWFGGHVALDPWL